VSSYAPGLNATVEGYPINSYFLYQTNGLFANEEEVTAYYDALYNGGEIPDPNNQAVVLRPGDTWKRDLDGSGNISGSGNIIDGNGDVKYMGDNAPHYVYGINLGVQWKGFDLSTFFQGALEHYVVRTDLMAYPFRVVYGNQTSGYLGRTWTESNTDAKYPRMTSHVPRATWNWANNDFMMLNNRYVRLKTLVVGYTLRDLKVTNNYSLSNVRVYFSGNDLFETTAIKDGWDPESGASTNNFYPFNRTYSFGLNVTF
jgi:hypothetical protein